MSKFEQPAYHPFLSPPEKPSLKMEPAQDILATETEDINIKNEKLPMETTPTEFFSPHDTRRTASRQRFNSLSFLESKVLADGNSEVPAPFEKNNAHKKPLRPFDAKYAANSLNNHPAIRENQASNEKQKAELQRGNIVKIFQSLDLNKIINTLKSSEINPYFQEEIDKTKKQHGERLSSATFLDDMDWKILTGIKLFNKETFEHSIGTYLIARNTIENDLPELAVEIQNEGVTLEQFYRACLFHDIGKMAIPEFILNSKVTDEMWVTGFMMLPESIDKVDKEIVAEFKDQQEAQAYADKNCQDDILVARGLTPPDAIRADHKALSEYFEENRIRAVEFVPIRGMLTVDQAQKLNEGGIDTQLSLKEIMQLHEKKSEETLKKLGFVIEAFLAGNHHNYKARNKRLGEKPISLSSLHIATIIHLADIEQALSVDRTYHHKQPALKIMAILVDDAESETMDPALTARWIRKRLAKMSPAYLDEVRAMKNEKQTVEYRRNRKNELETIENFLNYWQEDFSASDIRLAA